MRVRLGAAGAAAAICIAVGLLVSSATSAAPAASKASPATVLAGFHGGAAAGRHPATTVKRARTRVRNFSGKDAVGIFRNLTPYTLTFVGRGRFNSGQNVSDWAVDFPKTLNPGDQFIYRLNPYNDYASTQEYDGWFTYRADTLHHSEYLSIQLDGSHCTGVCLPRDGPPLAVSAFNGSAPPHFTSYGWELGSQTSSPEITWTSSGTTPVFPHLFNPDYTADFDYTFEVQGTYNIDASKIPSNQSGTLAQVLNGLCATNGLAACSFTPTRPLTFTTGALAPYFAEPTARSMLRGASRCLRLPGRSPSRRRANLASASAGA